jgi:hypothetical protein
LAKIRSVDLGFEALALIHAVATGRGPVSRLPASSLRFDLSQHGLRFFKRCLGLGERRAGGCVSASFFDFGREALALGIHFLGACPGAGGAAAIRRGGG